jgi:hypothetical protein
MTKLKKATMPAAIWFSFLFIFGVVFLVLFGKLQVIYVSFEQLKLFGIFVFVSLITMVWMFVLIWVKNPIFKGKIVIKTLCGYIGLCIFFVGISGMASITSVRLMSSLIKFIDLGEKYELILTCEKSERKKYLGWVSYAKDQHDNDYVLEGVGQVCPISVSVAGHQKRTIKVLGNQSPFGLSLENVEVISNNFIKWN